MATAALLFCPKSSASQRPIPTIGFSIPTTSMSTTRRRKPLKPIIIGDVLQNQVGMAALIGAGFALTLGGPASATEFPLWGTSLQLNEPDNALSLPTWVIHVSSVIEWITAMVLVWQYGEKSGFESWKGLSWGMVPLLGGAFCACTWHFFYNSESLEVLVALQAALTVIGNFTMCIAAYRIYKASQGGPGNL